MLTAPQFVKRPEHVHGLLPTPEAYAMRQVEILQQFRLTRPSMPAATVHHANTTPDPVIVEMDRRALEAALAALDAQRALPEQARNDDDRRAYIAQIETLLTAIDGHPPVFVSRGAWVLNCTCQNCPSVSPEWSVARCCECGAVYTPIVMPDRWQEIEAALVARPDIRDRFWHPGITVEELIAENAARGWRAVEV